MALRRTWCKLIPQGKLTNAYCAAVAVWMGVCLLPGFVVGDVFEQIDAKAQDMARQPFEPLETQLPPALSQLDYDDYRKIELIREKALWWNDSTQPFRLQFFHRGYIYPHRVNINLIEDGEIRPLPFNANDYRYHEGRPEGVEKLQGFVGFRVLYPLNELGKYDEVASFLGASYFRAVPRSGVYGASARALAIDIGVPERAEEFPRFREFWIEKPKADAKRLKIYAMLDSPAVVGAYMFELSPGTTIHVRASLYFRHGVTKLGLAPLTSMYYYGPNDKGQRIQRDHRPRVHDSDRLVIFEDSQTRVEPLQHPATPEVRRFAINNLEAFGLMQSLRHASDYQDVEARPELRPNVNVVVDRTPESPWEAGHVELLELPAQHEGIDNIGTYFVPAVPVNGGDHLLLQYRLDFMLQPLTYLETHHE